MIDCSNKASAPLRFSAESGNRPASNHSRYAFTGFSRVSRRVTPPELKTEGFATKLREDTTAKRKAKEEEDRIKAQYG